MSIDEFLQRVGLQPKSNIWSAIAVDFSSLEEMVEELQETIEIFVECEVGVISGKTGTIDLIEQLKNAPEEYLLLCDLESWDREDWQQFDGFRSWLDREKYGGILLLSPESLQKMLQYAPNFLSWLGSRVYDFQQDGEFLNSDEREQRLSALREWSGLSDSEVIESAELHQLPTDPEYGEWLILLDRGDLIER
ncbi:ABC transporter permease [Lusitaniella coriacea LEGE 07157]|uniref:ABC transporter permease n=1 Tax=Lusitaniella coriacea LEGE 07157 TaxID=945747 RepID=A0A8J7E0D2_9CYAN|nr:ABC transporter permease [Lusitaniella coriacea]MBE9118987.1 ABC transporter permease [Lusitaniella coriacea LEGE 07157]